MDEFDDIEVPDKLHIIISVRDFRAILQHANWTSTELNAAYSRPGRPMKISYNGDGIVCEFILMTVDEKSTISAQKKGKQQAAAAKQARPALEAASSGRTASQADNRPRQPSPPQQPQQAPLVPRSQMPPPPRPVPRSSQFDIRAPTKQPPSTLKSDSLFMPQPDEDEQWEPVNPEDDDDDDGENARLEWNASDEPVSSLPGCIERTIADVICRPQPCVSATISTIPRATLSTSPASTCPRDWTLHRSWMMFANLPSFPVRLDKARRFTRWELGVDHIRSCVP